MPTRVAAKAALGHLTRAMALELARHRIRVNALREGLEYPHADARRLIQRRS